jgi:adenine-specific DNA methylase
LDGVFTDPPYFGNVQYAELMDFCYVWLRRLLGERFKEFASPSTRQQQELTGNVTLGRDIEHFTEGLSAVFGRMAEALKPGAPLAFTFHHNDLDAYVPIAVAILDTGLACSTTLPCPAEMGGSIHIHGTLSSIIDTVFVCRSTGITSRQWLTSDAEGLAAVVQEQLDQLQLAGVEPTRGDARCLIAGHLSRLAIWHNREGWRRSLPTVERIGTIRKWFDRQGGIEAVLPHLEKAALLAVRVAEPPQGNVSPHDEVSF